MRKSYENMAAATREQTAALVPAKPEVKGAETSTQSIAEAIEADKEAPIRRSFLTPPTATRTQRPKGGGVKTRRLARKDRRGRRSLRNTLSAAARLNIQRGSSNLQV